MLNKEQIAAEFSKGQKDGIVGTATVMLKIIDGTDVGQNVLANKELEKIRRIFLEWRGYLIENADKDKKVAAVLQKTKSILES